MEEKIERDDIERILKEIKLRMGSENDLLEVIEKHPIPILLVAFGAGVILSQIDDYLIENVGKSRENSPIFDTIMKVGVPLIMKKFMM
ncbi:MAG: hypothetical protein GYA51_10700 [Candidatus Methanofastidiosa archaeon]|jgi:hypothetical protein|nr:hypothetical protein [Candidatus Methanofastidiosa archaeon]